MILTRALLRFATLWYTLLLQSNHPSPASKSPPSPTAEAELVLSPGRLLIFRHDRLSFTYTGGTGCVRTDVPTKPLF